MDSDRVFAEIAASFLMVFRRVARLVAVPYKTMREIAGERDIGQLLILFGFIFAYFVVANTVKPTGMPSVVEFAIALFNYVATVLFVLFFSRLMGHKENVSAPFFTFGYALVPTFAWFIVNTLLFVLLPPPRSVTLLGQTFSIVFIALSISLLAWKIMLWYLAVRFSTKLSFYEIMFLAVLYAAVAVPYAFFMYHLGFSRIPFL
jgi:hypothetical protein